MRCPCGYETFGTRVKVNRAQPVRRYVPIGGAVGCGLGAVALGTAMGVTTSSYGQLDLSITTGSLETVCLSCHRVRRGNAIGGGTPLIPIRFDDEIYVLMTDVIDPACMTAQLLGQGDPVILAISVVTDEREAETVLLSISCPETVAMLPYDAVIGQTIYHVSLPAELADGTYQLVFVDHCLNVTTPVMSILVGDPILLYLYYSIRDPVIGVDLGTQANYDVLEQALRSLEGTTSRVKLVRGEIADEEVMATLLGDRLPTFPYNPYGRQSRDLIALLGWFTLIKAPGDEGYELPGEEGTYFETDPPGTLLPGQLISKSVILHPAVVDEQPVLEPLTGPFVLYLFPVIGDVYTDYAAQENYAAIEQAWRSLEGTVSPATYTLGTPPFTYPDHMPDWNAVMPLVRDRIPDMPYNPRGRPSADLVRMNRWGTYRLVTRYGRQDFINTDPPNTLPAGQLIELLSLRTPEPFEDGSGGWPNPYVWFGISYVLRGGSNGAYRRKANYNAVDAAISTFRGYYNEGKFPQPVNASTVAAFLAGLTFPSNPDGLDASQIYTGRDLPVHKGGSADQSLGDETRPGVTWAVVKYTSFKDAGIDSTAEIVATAEAGSVDAGTAVWRWDILHPAPVEPPAYSEEIGQSAWGQWLFVTPGLGPVYSATGPERSRRTERDFIFTALAYDDLMDNGMMVPHPAAWNPGDGNQVNRQINASSGPNALRSERGEFTIGFRARVFSLNTYVNFLGDNHYTDPDPNNPDPGSGATIYFFVRPDGRVGMTFAVVGSEPEVHMAPTLTWPDLEHWHYASFRYEIYASDGGGTGGVMSKITFGIDDTFESVPYAVELPTPRTTRLELRGIDGFGFTTDVLAEPDAAIADLSIWKYTVFPPKMSDEIGNGVLGGFYSRGDK